MLLRPVSLEQRVALGIGVAAYIVSYETRSREPVLTASRLPAAADFLFKMETSMGLRSKTHLQQFFGMVCPNFMYNVVSKLVGSCCDIGAVVLASDLQNYIKLQNRWDSAWCPLKSYLCLILTSLSAEETWTCRGEILAPLGQQQSFLWVYWGQDCPCVGWAQVGVGQVEPGILFSGWIISRLWGRGRGVKKKKIRGCIILSGLYFWLKSSLQFPHWPLEGRSRPVNRRFRDLPDFSGCEFWKFGDCEYRGFLLLLMHNFS